MSDRLNPQESVSHEIERTAIHFFVETAKMLGLPKSIGEIYGLLYIRQEPLALDDLVDILGISKGSASQGLRALRDLGAVTEVEMEGERRTYYSPGVELKRLVGGFIREQIRPHLASGKDKVNQLRANLQDIEDPEKKAFIEKRVKKLDDWLFRSAFVLPVVQKLLGE